MQRKFFLLFRDLPQQILEKKLQSIRAALDEIVIEEYPELHISASIGGDYGEAKARFQNDACASLICSRATTACKT